MNDANPLYSSYIVNCVLNAFSAYTAIMLNILTIHAIRKTSSLPKPLKKLLLSLAVSDLGVGLLVQPLYIAWMVNSVNFTSTAFSDIITFLFVNASFFLVVAISVDRFLAIYLHLRYQELVTHKRVVAVVILIWVLSVFLSLFVSFTSTELYNVAIASIASFCFIITGIVYCRIYFTIRHHANHIQLLQIQLAQNSQIESVARQKKSAISMFYVYVVFLVCCLPQYCVGVALLISPPSTALHVHVTGLMLYSKTLMFLNSSLNPVIYGWRMRHIRRAMIDVLRNLFPKQNQENL